METKANPNPNGCLARALPHEPYVVFLARDLAVPATLRFWADLRSQMSVEDIKHQDAGQIAEMLDTADIMERWREDHDGEWREADAKRAALIERYARTIANARSPEESVDAIWMAHIPEAEAALALAELIESER